MVMAEDAMLGDFLAFKPGGLVCGKGRGLLDC